MTQPHEVRDPTPGGPSFTILRPSGGGVPLLFDSPHSGRAYPDDFGAAAGLADLRRGEDAYVDELIGAAPLQGVTVLLADVPRCYVDLNRAPDDIDAGMLDGPWPGPLAPTEKSARGLGLIRRFVVPGVSVYSRLLSVAEVQRRIDRVYLPYHAALRDLRARLLERYGTLWHIDWHSMKSKGNAMTPDGEGAARPDFVLGDLHGRSAHPSVTGVVARLLEGMGYSVSMNVPYAGGRIVGSMGDPEAGVHSVQVEINRRLYLDEGSVEKTEGFERLRQDLSTFVTSLVELVG